MESPALVVQVFGKTLEPRRDRKKLCLSCHIPLSSAKATAPPSIAPNLLRPTQRKQPVGYIAPGAT